MFLCSFLVGPIASFTTSWTYRMHSAPWTLSVSAQEETTAAPPSKIIVSDANFPREKGGDGMDPTEEPRTAWRASFRVSKKTQLLIQLAAVDSVGVQRTGLQRASAVLEALLNVPPDRCNAANLVCALTLSAKLLDSHARPNAGFRQLLFRAMEILDDLVVQESLNSRQLCNAVWAVAKHYDRDSRLLPEPSPMAIVSSDQCSVAEIWDLREGDEKQREMSPPQRVHSTIQEIARQLTAMLRGEAAIRHESCNGNSKERSKTANREIKLGEICMASWAYGILKPRQRPPGWLQTPPMGKLSSKVNQLDDSLSTRTIDFMLFGQCNDEGSPLVKPNAIGNTIGQDDRVPKDAADGLFDAMGEALCRPLHRGAKQHSSMVNPQFNLTRIVDCTWSELANLAWAYGKRGYCLSTESETLLRALSSEAGRRLQTGGGETRGMLSRDISQLIGALGSLQHDNFRLADDLVALLDHFSEFLVSQKMVESWRPFQEWSCPDIVQTILSLSHARVDDSELLLALFQEAHTRLEKGIHSEPRRQEGCKLFLAWEVCVMLWAQARLHLTASEGDIYGEFPQRGAACITSAAKGARLSHVGIGPQEQANVAWALTVLQHYQSDEAVELLRCVFSDASNSCHEEGLIQPEHAHQLWQALFLLEEESPSAVNAVPRWFRAYLSEKWELEKSKKKVSSARHKSISDVLNLMGIAHYNEHDEDIDVAIVLKSHASWAHQTEVTGNVDDAKKVAVEFDGPNHFTRKIIPRDGSPIATKSVRALGHTVLKYRLLKRKGWTVVRVPYYEFDKIPFWASMERQRYMQRLLKTHANISFSDVDSSQYSSMVPSRKTRFD